MRVRAAGCARPASAPQPGLLVKIEIWWEATVAFLAASDFVCCGNLNSYLVLCEFAMEIGQALFCPVMETRLSCLHSKPVRPGLASSLQLYKSWELNQ